MVGEEKIDREGRRDRRTREGKGSETSVGEETPDDWGGGIDGDTTNRDATERDAALTKGDLPGYKPTPEERQIQAVYIYWVHADNWRHLYGGFKENLRGQAWRQDFAVLLLRCYDAPGREVVRRFIRALSADLTCIR